MIDAGVEKDEARAVELYREAARHADALYECRRQTLGCQVPRKMERKRRIWYDLCARKSVP